MGVSAFAQVTVVSQFSIVKVPDNSDPDVCALLGCGVTTGFGATQNNVQVGAGDRVAVIGLGAVGLAAVQGARYSKASQIIAVDLNAGKFELARKYGATDVLNPASLPEGKSLSDALLEMSDGGLDYVFECVGNTNLMKQGLLACHKGWGKLVVIGVAPAGAEIAFRPFLVVTGRWVGGSAFGGVKGKSQLPGYLELVRQGHLQLDDMITARFPSFSKLNDAAHEMHAGTAIRSTFDMAKAE
jgi:S-(hydroxymethyl)glutathione dehydrogenase/alcohol dehydrogenase